MIQDELRQALTGLMPPSPAATIPIAPTIPSTANASSTPTVPTTFAVPHAIFVLPTATLTNVPLLLMIVRANPQIVLKLSLPYK